METTKVYQIQATLKGGSEHPFTQVFTTADKAVDWAVRLQMPVTLICGTVLEGIVFQSYKIVELEVVS